MFNSEIRLVTKCLSIYFFSHCLLLSPALGSQSKFEEARARLEEIDRLQKQKRDKDTVEKLTKLVNSAPQQVEQLLKEGTVELLNTAGDHSSQEIQEKLSAALQIAPPDQYKPEVFVFSAASLHGPSFLVAYNVPFCAACSRAWIGLIGKKRDHYEVLSESGASFAGKSLQVVPLDRTEQALGRFLVYGTNLGDSHSRFSVVAYALDKYELKEIWSREDLPQGNIKIANSKISLTFLTALRPPCAERTENYSLLSNRIELLNWSEHPAP